MVERSQPYSERRRVTRGSIYRYLYDAPLPQTKQNIAEALSLSLPTVHQHLTELLDAGLVQRCGVQQSTGGRRATCLAVDADARFAVGVSISGEHLRFLAANLRLQEIAYRKVLRTSAATISALGAELGAALEAFLTEFSLDRKKLLGVGIAVPGVIDYEHEKILFAPTLRLRDADLKPLIQAIPYPVSISNDATSGGHAEWFAQSGRENMAYLLLEGGVGGAVLVDGSSYTGTNGRSGEFGHMCVHTGGRLCKCGKRGCLEAYCSANRLSNDLGISLETFFARLEEHNPTYQALWQDYLEHLAIGVNNIRMALDCNVVLGGYMAQYLEPYLPVLRRMAAALNTFEDNADYLRLCHYPKHVVPLGVALHFIDTFIGSL